MNLKSIVIVSILFISALFKFSFSQDSLRLIATIQGEKIGDQFSVVAGVGDLNGDGYDDFVVGAPGGNYAKLYLGGSPFDTTADLRFSSTGQWDQFGAAVAGNGDLNGDGFNDFIIGAPGFGEFKHGRAYVHFGGINMDTIPDLILEKFGYYYKFGSSVSMAGDVNNDGYQDLIVGAPNDDYDAHGRAYIYYGGDEMDNIADVYLEGQESADLFGTSVDGVGDVNKDDYDDILIGAPQDLKGGAGKAYLVYGGPSISLDSSVTFLNDSLLAYDYFGRVVSGLDDINGDSFVDFGILSGTLIRIISGKTVEVLQDIHMLPDWGHFVDLKTGSDLNNDGLNDILLSTEKIDNILTGGVLFIWGTEDTNEIYPDFELPGPYSPSNFGSYIAYCGNLENKETKNFIVAEGLCISDIRGSVFIYSYKNITRIKKQKLVYFPKNLKLFQNYPNPFNGTTNIKYQLFSKAQTTLQIFDTNGCLIKNIYLGVQPSGVHIYKWNGKSNISNEISSGIYYLRLKVQLRNPRNPIFSKMQKLVFIK